ncbi:shikimate dehydrogenase [Burkholderia cepacia]|uniref:shikimate dehydrogenase n=1 Tax=Burkholderia cepacia TaxID=292 RepID=UPI003D6731C8
MTDQYAVIGNPIGHTKSPLIHGLFAQETRQDLGYTAIEGPIEPAGAFADAVRAFFDGGGKGINVTAPFKLDAFAMSDERSERAQLAGAANALKFEGGRILADNFDGIGLVRDIETNLNLPMAGKRVLVLGAGGAARGSVFSPAGTAYELAYGKRLTPFLRLAKNAGVHGIADGVGMLVEQAAEAFAWWRGVRPQTSAVIDRLAVPFD